MEFLGYILVIGICLSGFAILFKDGRENGIGFVICEVLAVIILAALGL